METETERTKEHSTDDETETPTTDEIRLLAEAEARIEAVQESIDRDNDAWTPLDAAQDAVREAETALVDEEVNAARESFEEAV